MTKQGTVSLAERYVDTTVSAVPEARRGDLARELRSTIEDMIEARVAAGEQSEAAERSALIELGDPIGFAAQYSGARQQLLGPRFYPSWKRLTVQLLTWLPALVAMVVAATAVFEAGNDFVDVFLDALGAGLGTAIQLVFWTTLVFVLLDRYVTEDPQAWTPDLLPETSGGSAPSYGDTAASIGWSVVVAAAIIAQQLQPWPHGGNDSGLPVLNPDLWQGWLPFLLVVICAGICLDLWKHRHGWTWGAVVGTAITSIAFSVPVAWLALESRLLNPEFLEAVELGAAGRDALHLAIAAGATCVAVWEIGEAALARRRA